MPLSEKQIPQIVVNVRSWRRAMETLEPTTVLRTQRSIWAGTADRQAKNRSVANAPSIRFYSGTILRSLVLSDQFPLGSRIAAYSAIRSQNRLTNASPLRAPYYLAAPKNPARHVGGTARIANKLLTRDSEAIKTKRNVLDVSC